MKVLSKFVEHKKIGSFDEGLPVIGIIITKL